MNKIKNAIQNSLISFVLGDMMVTPVEFISRDILKEYLAKYTYEELVKIRENIVQPFGSWSDYSSMTFCTIVVHIYIWNSCVKKFSHHILSEPNCFINKFNLKRDLSVLSFINYYLTFVFYVKKFSIK